MHVQLLQRSFDFIFLPDYVQRPANCAARRPMQAILFLRHDMSSISGKHFVHLLQTQQKFDCCIYAYWNAYELIVALCRSMTASKGIKEKLKNAAFTARKYGSNICKVTRVNKSKRDNCNKQNVGKWAIALRNGWSTPGGATVLTATAWLEIISCLRRRKTPGLTMHVLASPLHLTLSASTNFHLRFEALLAKISNFLPSSIFRRVQCDEPTMATASRLRDW